MAFSPLDERISRPKVAKFHGVSSTSRAPDGLGTPADWPPPRVGPRQLRSSGMTAAPGSPGAPKSDVGFDFRRARGLWA